MKFAKLNMLKKLSTFKNVGGFVGCKRMETMMSAHDRQIVIEELKDREIIKVHGEESMPFLQGLITSDMNQLMSGRISGHGYPTMYAMFLNKSGRLLYDTIIYKTRDPFTFLIECDKAISFELQRHLEVYRVRSTVEVDSVADSFKPWVIFDPDAIGGGNLSVRRLGADSIYAQDPRIRGLGWRLLTTPERSFGDVARAFAIPGETGVLGATNENNYRYHRYRYGVGEGVEDFPPGKFNPFEVNADYLNALSFNKGCFIGQELTESTYRQGGLRKRLMPIRLIATPVKPGANIRTELCANVGVLCGVCNDRALGVLRVDHVLRSAKVSIDGEKCYVCKPRWWPIELRLKSSMVGRV